jgi:hypothetical protein
MKKIVTLAFCLALPACVAPPALTIASLALSGVSFVQTGKTLPDHALSSVAQRDCQMFRATRGEQICQVDTTLGLDGPIAVAIAPTDATGAPWPDDITALPAPLEPLPEPTAAPIQPVVVASLAPIPVPVPVMAPALPSPSGSTLDQAPDAPLVAAPIDEIPQTTTAPARESAVAPDVAGQIAATESRDTETQARSSARDAQRVESARHLVVGSFRDRARANAHIARLGDDDLGVLTSEVKGRIQYRVVTGPYAASDLAAAKREFATRGIKGAWPIKLRDTPSGFQIAAR